MATHRIYYSKGAQPLVTVPHRDGRPVRVTAGTYGIFDTRYPESSEDHVLVAAGTAASVDAVSTTLAAKAGRNAQDHRALSLASTAGMLPGHSYLLEAADGKAELVRIVSVPNATTALAIAEIRGDYPSASTLKGVEVSASFPSGAANDEDSIRNRDGMPWIIVWAFSGFPPLRESIFMERGEESLLATLDDLRELDPYLSNVGGDRIEPSLALARAHRDFRTDLMLAGASEADYLSGPIGRDAVVYRAAALALQHSDDESSQRRAEAYEKRYQEIRASLQIGSKKPQVTTLDKTQESAEAINPAALFLPFGMVKP